MVLHFLPKILMIGDTPKFEPEILINSPPDVDAIFGSILVTVGDGRKIAIGSLILTPTCNRIVLLPPLPSGRTNVNDDVVDVSTFS